jgi:hypothetical protein
MRILVFPWFLVESFPNLDAVEASVREVFCAGKFVSILVVHRGMVPSVEVFSFAPVNCVRIAPRTSEKMGESIGGALAKFEKKNKRQYFFGVLSRGNALRSQVVQAFGRGCRVYFIELNDVSEEGNFFDISLSSESENKYNFFAQKPVECKVSGNSLPSAIPAEKH